jgi:hypothetical protein
MVDLFQRDAEAIGEEILIQLFGRKLISRHEVNALLGSVARILFPSHLTVTDSLICLLQA